jgi:hypothetical protein
MIKKLQRWIQKQIRLFVLSWFHKHKDYIPREKIIELYLRIRRENLILTDKIVTVKKGKLKYKVMLIETPELETRLIINRHNELETEDGQKL